MHHCPGTPISRGIQISKKRHVSSFFRAPHDSRNHIKAAETDKARMSREGKLTRRTLVVVVLREIFLDMLFLAIMTFLPRPLLYLIMSSPDSATNSARGLSRITP